MEMKVKSGFIALWATIFCALCSVLNYSFGRMKWVIQFYADGGFTCCSMYTEYTSKTEQEAWQYAIPNIAIHLKPPLHTHACTHLLTSAESFLHFDGTEWCLSHWRECAKIIGIKHNSQERGHGNTSGTA